MKTREITKIAILTSICVVISIIESYFTFIGDIIPGLKLGLANIVIIFAFVRLRLSTYVVSELDPRETPPEGYKRIRLLFAVWFFPPSMVPTTRGTRISRMAM